MSAGKTLHPAIAEIVEMRRLGALEASRHRFTVSRAAALLRLREQAKARAEDESDGAWLWTLSLVRAANAVSDAARIRIRVEPSFDGDEALEAVIFEVLTPGFDCRRLDTRDLLAGALEGDVGEPLSEESEGGSEDAVRLRRVQALLGRAINEALAAEPRVLAVRTPAPSGGRRFEPREQIVEGRDPYGDRRLVPLEGESQIVVEFVRPRAGLGTRLGRWVRGRSSTEAVIVALWQRRGLDERGDADDDDGVEKEDGGLSVSPIEVLGAPAIALGKHGRLGPRLRLKAPPVAGPRAWAGQWLLRDGVRILDLSPTMRQHLGEAGVAALGPAWIDCPSLRLTADERSVVQDSALELLIAWIHHYLEARAPDGSVEWPKGVFAEDHGPGPEVPDDGITRVGPPADPRPGLRSASGWVVPRAFIDGEARRNRELLYVWRHRVSAIAGHDRDKVLALWPAQMEGLQAEFPELSLVPALVLYGLPDRKPEDLSRLRADSYPPLVLSRATPVALSPESEAKLGPLCVSVEAYVHRSPAATTGFLALLAYERRLVQYSDRDHALPGLTVIGRVAPQVGPGELPPEIDMVALRRDGGAVAALAAACRDKTIEHWEPLLSHVVSQANPWETPLLSSALARLTPATLGLRYRATEQGLRLSWRETALLDVQVGRDAQGQPQRLRDALLLLRDRGVIVVGDARRRPSLRSKDPRLHPWSIVGVQKELVVRTLGRAALLPMPTTPEAYPLVKDSPEALVEDQRHLIAPAHVSADLSRANKEPRARERLLGLLLMTRALGHDTAGLEDRPLLERYDSRAANPTRLVSLREAISEQPRPGLVPTGAVRRSLPRPVIEAPPGLAALLAKVEGFEAAASEADADAESSTARGAQGGRGESSGAPIRRRARAAPPLLATTVADVLVVGRLQVASDGSADGISLWFGGLRERELKLPEPLGRVSGKLVMTPKGRRLDRLELQAHVAARARELLLSAPGQRALLPPLGRRREKLDHLLTYLRQTAKARDEFDMAEALGVDTKGERADRELELRRLSLRAAPLQPLPDQRVALLERVVVQSLAMKLRIGSAMLVWKAARLGRRRRDTIDLDFGLRNAWVQRALDEERVLDRDAHRHAALLAGALVVAEFFHQARPREDLALSDEHLSVALWRLLQLR